MTATLTLHPSWDPEDECLVAHADPDCVFAAHGLAVADDAGLRTIDCRFCIGGHDPASLGRAPILLASDTETLNANNRKTRPERRTEPGDGKPYEERLAEVSAWLLDLGRKTEIMDITHANKRLAADWLRRYDGDLAFLLDVKAKGGVRSDGQAKAVLNCLRAELLRGPRPSVEPDPMSELPESVTDFLP